MAVTGLSDKGVWQHVAVVYQKDGSATGYLNGGKSGTFESAFDFKGIKAGIAARFIDEHGSPFAGALDDFRIYSHALTNDEVKALYSPELLYPPTQVNRAKAAASKAGGWTLYPYHGPAAATAQWDEKAKALNLHLQLLRERLLTSEPPVRKFLLKRFPYRVRYSLAENQIILLTLEDMSKDKPL